MGSAGGSRVAVHGSRFSLGIFVLSLLTVPADSRFTMDSMNQHLLDTRYAVRGEVLDVAMALKKRLADHPDDHGLPFDEVISCNIGNPQALGQPPPKFNRQVMSLVTNPELLETATNAFVPEAIARAKNYLDRMGQGACIRDRHVTADDPGVLSLVGKYRGGSMTSGRSTLSCHANNQSLAFCLLAGGIGAYSNSKGIAVVREEVADFIERRDGFPSSTDDIFLTNGASEAVRNIMHAMLRGGNQRDGVLVPIPQYPLYSALTKLFDGELLGYYLDENQGWGLVLDELERAYQDGVARGPVTTLVAAAE